MDEPYPPFSPLPRTAVLLLPRVEFTCGRRVAAPPRRRGQMDIVPTIMVLYLWCTCRGQPHSPIFKVSIFTIELRPCLLSIFFRKYTMCSLSSSLKVTFPLFQSIIVPEVLRQGLRSIIDMLPSS